MHIFQPKHIKLKKEEAEAVLKKFNISLVQLPKIKKKDSALEGLDVKSGDVIKIERRDKKIYYRAVI